MKNKSDISKEDVSGKEIEGAKLQVIDTDGNVIDEMKIYFQKKTIKKISSICTFENALALVNLARVNRRITGKQARNIKKIMKEIR